MLHIQEQQHDRKQPSRAIDNMPQKFWANKTEQDRSASQATTSPVSLACPDAAGTTAGKQQVILKQQLMKQQLLEKIDENAWDSLPAKNSSVRSNHNLHFVSFLD